MYGKATNTKVYMSISYFIPCQSRSIHKVVLKDKQPRFFFFSLTIYCKVRLHSESVYHTKNRGEIMTRRARAHSAARPREARRIKHTFSRYNDFSS